MHKCRAPGRVLAPGSSSWQWALTGSMPGMERQTGRPRWHFVFVAVLSSQILGRCLVHCQPLGEEAAQEVHHAERATPDRAAARLAGQRSATPAKGVSCVA